MSFRHVIGFFLILTSSVLPSPGQGRSNTRNSNFSIAGNVRDDTDEQTMENVRVDLKLATGIPINTTFTRGNGEFEFGTLGNGEYVIEVDLKDYEPFRQSVTISNGSQRGVSVFLTRPRSSRQSNPRNSVSAHELSVPGKAHGEYEKGLQLLYSKLDYQGAIGQFQRAIKFFPTFYEAYAQMGNAYVELKELAPAEEAMRKSVELSSGQYSDAIFMLAGLLNDTSRWADAEEMARQGSDVDAGSWRGPFELARALGGLNKLEDAEKNAAHAHELKPDNPSVYLLQANIHIQRHDYSSLQGDLEGFVKLVPNGPEAEQARKTLDELRAARQEATNQSHQSQANVQSASSSEGQRKPRVDAPPPLDPDSSGLPSLPPPLPDIQ
jgi:tetratricopeptide (TPR) repeat protein